MGQGKALAGFLAVVFCVIFFCALTTSFAADKTMKPATTVKKVQTAPAKTTQQKKMMMKSVKATCPGPDLIAKIDVQVISQDAHGHGGRVRITGIVKNQGGADFASGAGQQAWILKSQALV